MHSTVHAASAAAAAAALPALQQSHRSAAAPMQAASASASARHPHPLASTLPCSLSSSAASSSQPRAPAVAAEASDPLQAPLLRRVDVIATDGSNSQCFYIAVAAALGISGQKATSRGSKLCWPELQRRLRTVLDGIDSAALLCSYGFDVSPSSDATGVQRVKAAYLATANFQQQTWGGTLEMYLLSHHEQGRLCFRTYDSVSQRWSFVCALPGGSVPSSLQTDSTSLRPCWVAEAQCVPTKEIVLHFCAYQGGDRCNHFEQVTFALHSGEVTRIWPPSGENPQARDRRVALIMEGCDRSRQFTLAAHQADEQRNLQLASDMGRTGLLTPGGGEGGTAPHASRTRASIKRPAEPNALFSPPAGKRANTSKDSAAPVPCSAAHWLQTRQRGVPSLHPALLRTMPPTFAPLILPAGSARVEVRIQPELSRQHLDRPLELGLYATADFDVKEEVTPYGGILTHVADYVTNPAWPKTHARRLESSEFKLDGLPISMLFRRPVPGTVARLETILRAGMGPLMPTSKDVSSAHLAIFRESAMGFMANTAAVCNVRSSSKQVIAGDIVYSVPVLIATRAIRAGEEILCRYGNNESKQLLTSVTMQKPIKLALTPRSLLVDHPSRLQCLHRQRDNLAKFLEERQAHFSKLRYWPWTRDRQRHSKIACKVEVRPSNLVPTILGVYPKHKFSTAKKSDSIARMPQARHVICVASDLIRALIWRVAAAVDLVASRKRFLLYYQGLLVSEKLLNKFVKHYHCPTALRLPQLDYRNSAGHKVKMFIIGDPTRPAAIVNDGPISGHPRQSQCLANRIVRCLVRCACNLNSCVSVCVLSANCELVTVRNVAQIMRLRKDGKIEIDADVAHITALCREQPFTPATELLCSYGGDKFWKSTADEGDYCATCFQKDFCRSGPRELIQCSGGSDCRVSRHAGCMPEKPSRQQIDSSAYYCPQHLAQLHFAQTPAEYKPLDISPKPRPPSLRPGAKARSISPLLCFTPPQPRLPSVRASSSPEPLCYTPLQPALIPSNAMEHSPEVLCFTPLAPPVAQSGRSGHVSGATAPRALQSCFSDTAEAPPRTTHSAAAPSRRVTSSVPRNGVAKPSNAGGGEQPPTVTAPFGRTHVGGSIANQVSYSARLETVHEEHAMEGGWDASSTDHSASSASDGESDASSDTCFSFDSDDPVHRRSAHRGTSAQRTAAPAPRPDPPPANVKRITLLIRTKEAAMKLPGWDLHYAPLTDSQREAVQRQYDSSDGWWKGTSRRSLRKQAFRRKLDEHGTPITARTASTTSRGAQSIPRGTSSESTTSEILKRATSNRWYDPVALAEDWAEYRCCCGSPAAVAKQLAGNPTAAATHSSANVLALFQARQRHRSVSKDRTGFAAAVSDEITSGSSRESAQPVRWDKGDVCVSCYRAVVGISRSSMYAYRNMVQEGTIKAIAKDGLFITPFGLLRQPRRRHKMDHTEALLFEYARTLGQTAPNAKGKNVAHSRIILPHSRIAELAIALNRLGFEQSGENSEVVKEGTLRHVLAELHMQGHKISVKPSKDMCRCEHCDLLDGKADKLRGADPESYRTTLAQKQMHLRQVKEQRDHFDAQKEMAQQKPTKLWCFTYDGMDQAKTQLPHLKGRLSKNLEPLVRLGVHAVGAFCFGAPVPVMGFLNFPDVRKDSSLSVCILDHALDIQFKKLEEMYGRRAAAAPVLERAAVLAAAAAASAAAGTVAQAESPPCAAGAGAAAATAPREHAETKSRSRYNDFGNHWPERLHVTFDNAASDAKNQFVFRYLGLLVLHGVFDAITVSTLIVGHTHDIVDQMFSVWSKLLRITDCKTYEQMRRLFHEKYRSRVRLLVKIMKNEVLTEDEAREAGVDDKEAKSDLAADQERDAFEWSAVAQQYAERLNDDLAREADAFNAGASSAGEARSSVPAPAPQFHTPHMVRQEYSFNIRSWLASMVLADGENVLKAYPMKGQTIPHVFAVERDRESGDIYLYNKYFSKSTDKSQRGEQHKFLWIQENPQEGTCSTGQYTARCLLFRAGDRAFTMKEPVANPPEIVEVDTLRQTIAAYVGQGKLDEAEQAEWAALLGTFESAQAALATECPECAKLISELNEIGVVSNKQSMSDSERKEQRKKMTDRNKARAALTKHLRQPHKSARVLPNFFGKWIERVQQHILPSYIQRGVKIPERFRTMDYHAHPANLCTDGRSGKDNPDNVIFDTDSRVDHACLLKRGLPCASQFVLVRCQGEKEPFGFGMIQRVLRVGEEPAWVGEHQNGLTLEQLLQLHPHEASMAAALPAADSDQCDERMHMEGGGVEASGALEQQVTFECGHKSDKARVSVDMGAIPNVLVEWYQLDSTDVAKLHLNPKNTEEEEKCKEWWDAHFQQHAAEDAAVTKRLGHKPPATGWIVDMYSSVRFKQLNRRERRAVFVRGSDLIEWANFSTDFLTSKHVLRSNVFSRLRYDLTEVLEYKAKKTPSKKRARAALPAAAAAETVQGASAAVPADIPSDSGAADAPRAKKAKTAAKGKSQPNSAAAAASAVKPVAKQLQSRKRKVQPELGRASKQRKRSGNPQRLCIAAEMQEDAASECEGADESESEESESEESHASHSDTSDSCSD
jgi:hypothetical protein